LNTEQRKSEDELPLFVVTTCFRLVEIALLLLHFLVLSHLLPSFFSQFGDIRHEILMGVLRVNRLPGFEGKGLIEGLDTNGLLSQADEGRRCST
jgi:hypothetical protein